jgi:hypothetical protein
MATFSFDWFNARELMMGSGSGLSFALQQQVVAFSLGYFLLDVVVMLWTGGGASRDAYIHHGIMVVAFLSGLHYRVAFPYHFFGLLEELSTPFLNAKALWRGTAWENLFQICFGMRVALRSACA